MKIYKEYTQVPNSAAGKLSAPDLYRYTCLSIQPRTEKNTMTDSTFLQIAELSLDPVRTIEKFAKRLRDTDVCFVNEANTPDSRRYVYTFPKHYNYRMVSADFIRMDMGISKKQQVVLKGFLIQLFSICVNNTKVTHYNISEMTSKLNSKGERIMKTSRNSASKYLKELIELGYVIKLDKGYKINCEHLWIKDYSKRIKILREDPKCARIMDTTKMDEIADLGEWLTQLESGTLFIDKELKNRKQESLEIIM